MLVIGGPLIPIRSDRVDVDALFSEDLLCAAYFPGQITAVEVIDQGLEGCIDTVDVTLSAAVKMVVHCDKPNAEKREYTGDIVANGNVVPAKA